MIDIFWEGRLAEEASGRRIHGHDAVLSANRAEQRSAHTGIVAFGNKTLIFREGEPGIFMAYLNSPVDDGVMKWLFDQVNPLLAEEGLKLE